MNEEDNERYLSGIFKQNFFDSPEWLCYGHTNSFSPVSFEGMKTREIRPGLFYSYMKYDQICIIAVWWDPNK